MIFPHATTVGRLVAGANTARASSLAHRKPLLRTHLSCGRIETGLIFETYPRCASNFFASSGVSTPMVGSSVTSIAMG